MKTKIVLKNSIYSIISYCLIFILGIISRKIFITYLNIEFLGYESLFSNIFNLLSLAELGVGTVLTYSLYQEIASNNKLEIAKLMMIYKYMYSIIGAIVTIIGLIILPLLKFIITDNITDWNYIRIIYLFQLTAIVCTYFLSYRRALYIADQKQFICIQIDTIINIISQVSRILALIVFKDYILCLLIAIIGNILSNSIISYKCKKHYPYATKAIIKKEDFTNRKFFKDIRNFIVHKLSYAVYGGVGNVVISMFLGIISVGLVSNYMLIVSQVGTLINKLILPIQASIGNLIYNEEKEKGKQLLFAFSLMGFFIGTFVSTSYMVLFQPVIQLWLGKEYLLPMSFVVLISINYNISWTHEIIYYYRSAFGEYEQDRKYMIFSAITNIVLSIIFVKLWGVTGIMVGTIAGALFIIYGRIQFVFKIYLQMSHMQYIIKYLFLSLLALVEGALTYYIASFISITIVGVLGKLILCLTIPNLINFLIFYKTKDFEVIKVYLNQIIEIIAEKFKKKNI